MAKLMVGAGRRPEGRQEWSMEPATRGSQHEARLRYGGRRTADRGVIQYVKYVKYVKSGGEEEGWAALGNFAPSRRTRQ